MVIINHCLMGKVLLGDRLIDKRSLHTSSVTMMMTMMMMMMMTIMDEA